MLLFLFFLKYHTVCAYFNATSPSIFYLCRFVYQQVERRWSFVINILRDNKLASFTHTHTHTEQVLIWKPSRTNLIDVHQWILYWNLMKGDLCDWLWLIFSRSNFFFSCVVLIHIVSQSQEIDQRQTILFCGPVLQVLMVEVTSYHFLCRSYRTARIVKLPIRLAAVWRMVTRTVPQND